MAALGTDSMGKFYPGILGMHGVNVLPIFPLVAVASFYLLDYVISILTRLTRRGEAGAAAVPTTRFSWLPPVSLILSSAGFFLPFVSIGGIVAGHAARRNHQKGPGLRGIGMATVGLITGYLFLSIWVYMSILFVSVYIYAVFLGRG